MRTRGRRDMSWPILSDEGELDCGRSRPQGAAPPGRCSLPAVATASRTRCSTLRGGRRAPAEALVERRQLGPVLGEMVEEVLARPGSQVDDTRPDVVGTAARASRTTPRAALAGRRCPGGPARRRRRRRLGLPQHRERAQPLRGGAVPGSVRRHTCSSSVGTEKLTLTCARPAASASTSTSRTISGPRVTMWNGFETAASASRQPRVSR